MTSVNLFTHIIISIYRSKWRFGPESWICLNRGYTWCNVKKKNKSQNVQNKEPGKQFPNGAAFISGSRSFCIKCCIPLVMYFLATWIVTACDLSRLSRLSRWLIHLRHLLMLFLNMSVCSIWLNSRSPWSRTLERKRESALRFKGPRHIQRASTSEYWHANDVQLRQQKPQCSDCTQPQWPLAWALTLL